MADLPGQALELPVPTVVVITVVAPQSLTKLAARQERDWVLDQSWVLALLLL